MKFIINFIKRILIPSIIAVFVYGYFLGTLEIKNGIDIRETIVQAVIKPYYHLCFLLGYTLYILMHSGLRGDRKNGKGVLLGVILVVIFYGQGVLVGNNDGVNEVVKIITRSLKLQFFLFFMIGAKLREVEDRLPRGSFETGFLSVILFGVTIMLFFHKGSGVEGYIHYIFNGVLIMFIVNCIIGGDLPKCRFIEWVGRNSMSFTCGTFWGKLL